jgi:hypothetical protein
MDFRLINGITTKMRIPEIIQARGSDVRKSTKLRFFFSLVIDYWVSCK